ncbi:MAG: sulfatase-like hydrolase/transferase [Planctomycetes bacterium]|nr:sulfatase-like hydrolase/transferase [Planctomycetota bacterium]
MTRLTFFRLAFLCLTPWVTLAAGAAVAPERPNILWITAEDLGPNLGCCGDPDAVTPQLDQFATQGVRFRNCFSIHPCCSPSRSALVTGVYPTRLGTFQHRGKMWVNPGLAPCFPALLRAAGYYTFNGSRGGSAKLDYNFEPKDQPWDKVGSKEIEWRHRRAGQPFFGQINLACTHQSQYGRRPPGGRPPAEAKGAQAPAPPVHDPAQVHVPPYHPDTPAVREIWAEYHDRITQMDGQFGALLRMLADDGLAEDTIVFFFGDNGHGIPGGKVWLWDQGPHVPLLVRFPEKWAHLTSSLPRISDRLVSFIDFAPTVLSLAGIRIPGSMQGTVFLGPQAGPPPRYVFAARDFHDGADFDTSRMVREERFHYIRNFMPHLGWDAIQYSWKQAPHLLEEWRQAAAAGRLHADTRQAAFFRRSKPVEELYDMVGDPAQMHNLAGDPQHQATLERMRAAGERWMLENRDLGLLSQYELYVRSEKDSPLEMGMDRGRNPIGPLLAAANLANRRDPAALPQLCRLLQADDGAVRRWGALGLLALRDQAAGATESLLAALKDASPDVRLTAAEALCGLDQVEAALPVLIALLAHESRIIRNETLLALCRVGPAAKGALPHLDQARAASRHEGIWSSDNIPDLIALVRACVDESKLAPLKLTRQRYHP